MLILIIASDSNIISDTFGASLSYQRYFYGRISLSAIAFLRGISINYWQYFYRVSLTYGFLDKIYECVFDRSIRTFCKAALCIDGTSVLTWRKSVFSPPYLHVEQALRNDVVHAFSKVLR